MVENIRNKGIKWKIDEMHAEPEVKVGRIKYFILLFFLNSVCVKKKKKE